jgi:hypothetical protein
MGVLAVCHTSHTGAIQITSHRRGLPPSPLFPYAQASLPALC